MMEFEYIEKDGLLYPNLELGDTDWLNNLDKYDEMRLRYLHTKKPEQIQEDYIAKHPLTEDDFWLRVRIRVMTQMVADEVVRFQVIEV